MSIDFNAPKPKSQLGSVDVYPNLLATVLAAASLFLPQHAGQVTQSAPQPKYQNQVDVTPAPIVLGLNPPPQVRQLYDSAPAVKYVPVSGMPLVMASGIPIIAAPPFNLQLNQSAPPPKTEVRSDPTIVFPAQLPINPAPNVLQLNQSAPPPKYQPQVDISPPITFLVGAQVVPRISFLSAPQAPKQNLDRQHVNLLPLTTVAVTPPQIQPSINLAPIPKYEVRAEVIERPVVLGLNPAPSAVQLIQSAPAPKAEVRSDVTPNYRPFQGILLPPVILQAGASAPPPKYEVYAHNPPAPFALGIPLNTTVVPSNSFNRAPQRAWQASVDPPANNILLLQATLPPVIGQLTQSAPIQRFEIRSDVYPNILTLPAGVPLPVTIGQLTASAPQPKTAVTADAIPMPSALGINLPPGVIQWFGSSPPPKYQTQIDPLPNLSVLVVTLPPVTGRWFDSAPPPKFQVTYEHPQRFPGLGINLPPNVQRWSDSAPIVKYQVFAQNFSSPASLGEPAAPPPPITFLRNDWPAPPPKIQVFSHPTITRPAILPVNPPPFVAQLNQSAPITKYQVVAEQYINPLIKPPIVIYPVEPQWIINLPYRNWTVTLTVSWTLNLPTRVWTVSA